MTATEVNPVIPCAARMAVGCLYNQEIDEAPQLSFSHVVKSGDAVTLAREVRRGLAHTDV